MTRRIFAVLAADGAPIGFFPSDVHPSPPAGAVEVSAADYGACLANPGRRRFVDGSLVAVDPPVPTADALRASVDAAAEAVRASMLTGGIGQAMSYQQKAAEADAVLAAAAAGVPLPAAPVLSALVGVEVDEQGQVCADLSAVATVVAAEAAAYRAAEGRVDAVRRRAKIGIGAAADAAGRQAWHDWAIAALPPALADETQPDPPA